MSRYCNEDLRKGRFSEHGRIYLITTVVKDREAVFDDYELGRLVVAELRNAERWGQAHSLAWVVMPNHLHWLFELHRGELPDLMRQVKCRSSRAVNRRAGREGSLWQAGYHDRALRADEDVQAAARYIVANPLRAGLVEGIGDYPLWDAVWL